MSDGSASDTPVSIREAARRLEVSALMIREMIHAGRLDAFRDNQGRWRLYLNDGQRGSIESAARSPPPSTEALLREEIEELAGELGERDQTVERLTALLAHQQDMLERYDKVSRGMAEQGAEAIRRSDALEGTLEHALSVLEQAIDRGEAATQDKAGTQAQLAHVVELLETAIDGSERALTARDQLEFSFVRSLDLLERSIGERSELQDTLARYDQMMERSLTVLQDAHAAREAAERRTSEREAQLDRALDLLDSVVGQAGTDAPSQRAERPGLLGRLWSRLTAKPT